MSSRCPADRCYPAKDGPYPVVVEIIDEWTQRWWSGPGPRDFGVVHPRGVSLADIKASMRKPTPSKALMNALYGDLPTHSRFD